MKENVNKNMRRKILLAVLICVLALGMLGGCAQDTGGTAETGGASEGKDTLVVIGVMRTESLDPRRGPAYGSERQPRHLRHTRCAWPRR
jgi:hypothetical protein